MSLTIKEIYKASDDEWDRIWSNCDYATYFQSREWAEIWQVYKGGKIFPEPLAILFSDGALALLPFSSEKVLRGLSKRRITSPAGTFGGWLSTDTLRESHYHLLFDYLDKHVKNLTWRLNPYDIGLNKASLANLTYDETHAIRLTGGFDLVRKRFRKGNKSSAKKALKSGVTVKEAVSIQEWRNYYHIYEDSLNRWGSKASSRYDWKLFQELYERKTKNVRLWLTYYEDISTAGALCFYAKRHVVYWHGASLKSHMHLGSANLLISNIINNSAQQGYAWFDFNPSGGHESVKSFKKSFGAEGLPCPVFRSESFMLKSLTTLRAKTFQLYKRAES